MEKPLGALVLMAWVAGCGVRTGSGDAGNQGDVAIEVQASCAAFTPCGGEVVGSWSYAEGCVEDPFPVIKSLCPAATYESLTVNAKGTLSFGSGTATRNVTLSGNGVLKVPAACAGSSCAALGATLTIAGIASTCSASGSAGDCQCTFSAKQVIDEATPYTLSGNSLTTNGRVYEYCVQDGALLHHETGATPKEPGTFLLNRN
ncbi:MAG: hypothetical protein ACYC8T_00300 [Myxococcaceae bacterium]